MDLLRGKVLAQSAELPRRHGRMDTNLLHVVVKDTNDPCVPSHPHSSAKMLGWYAVVRFIHRDMAITADLTLTFLKARKILQRQLPKCFSLDFFKDFENCFVVP